MNGRGGPREKNTSSNAFQSREKPGAKKVLTEGEGCGARTPRTSCPKRRGSFLQGHSKKVGVGQQKMAGVGEGYAWGGKPYSRQSKK